MSDDRTDFKNGAQNSPGGTLLYEARLKNQEPKKPVYRFPLLLNPGLALRREALPGNPRSSPIQISKSNGEGDRMKRLTLITVFGLLLLSLPALAFDRVITNGSDLWRTPGD